MSDIRFRPGAPVPHLDASAGILAGLKIIGADADERVPVDTGSLRDSQVIAVDGNTGGIGYTDPKAVAAHENLAVQLRDGREPKYLEAAVDANRPAVLAAVAVALRPQLDR